MGCHGGWFEPLADRLWSRGLRVFVADQRGNGRSAGTRGDIAHREQWLRDAEAIVACARRLAPGPLFLEGSSAGAVVALRYVLEHPEAVSGLVLLSPAFASKAGVVPLRTQIKVALASLFAPASLFAYPARYVDDGLTTGNPESLRMIRADPAYVRTATARFTMELFKLTRDVARRAAEIRMPTLLLQAGHDLVCEEKAARRFFECLGATDKHYRRYDEAYHGLELEAPARLEELAEEIARFTRARSSSRPMLGSRE
jgi:alpha-beta hydrolase superfamily lysophospholipase